MHAQVVSDDEKEYTHCGYDSGIATGLSVDAFLLLLGGIHRWFFSSARPIFFKGLVALSLVLTPYLWADSEWRSLKVQWDESSVIAQRDKVSPWELEPLVAANPTTSQSVQKNNKRTRTSILPAIRTDSTSIFGLWQAAPCESVQSLSFSRLHKGQELHTPSMPSSLFSSASNLGHRKSTIDSATCRPITTKHCDSSVEMTEKENKKQQISSDWRLFGFKLVKSSIAGEISPVTQGEWRYSETSTKQLGYR